MKYAVAGVHKHKFQQNLTKLQVAEGIRLK